MQDVPGDLSLSAPIWVGSQDLGDLGKSSKTDSENLQLQAGLRLSLRAYIVNPGVNNFIEFRFGNSELLQGANLRNMKLSMPWDPEGLAFDVMFGAKF